MKSDPIFRERERRREQKYFINGRLTPVWVPLSAPYPTQAIFPAGYGVINYILTASLCSFDFTVIKSAIEVSGPRKRGSQVGEGVEELGLFLIRQGVVRTRKTRMRVTVFSFTSLIISSYGLAHGIDSSGEKVPRHWKTPLLRLRFYSFWLFWHLYFFITLLFY